MSNIDQDGFNNQPSDWVDARAAAALLAVKLPTLYAYASRGLLQSAPGEKGRARRYLRADLLRLRSRAAARSGHEAVAAFALQFGDPVLESALTSVGPEGPRYRGQAAVALAENGVSFEATAELLFGGALPAAAPRWSAAPLDARPLLKLLGTGATPVGALLLLVPALALRDGARFGASEEAEIGRARALCRQLAAGLALVHDASRLRPALACDRIAGAVARALGGPEDEGALRAIDAALVLMADHELNTSTFAARVAASAGADLYACVGAGLAALSGPRHGAACDRVEALLLEVQRAGTATQAVRERLRRGEAIPGFGHPLYPAGDPRSPPLLRLARERAPKSAPLRTLLSIAGVMEELGQGAPGVELALVALATALGLPPGSATAIFAVARSAGWVAHTLEQRRSPVPLRPRARYTGP